MSNYRFLHDPQILLRVAPIAVDSFCPGHWDFMRGLEGRAQDVVERRKVAEFVEFLADVAFLKRPHTVDRDVIRRALVGYEAEILSALNALRAVDYAAMDVVARMPWFGRGGGRSFTSAVMRVVCPDGFGIIDWRNLAVLCGSPGFEGLTTPAVLFPQFSRDDVVVQRGQLPFTMDVYREYNDTLRALAAQHGARAADMDLVLWTYSIQRQPFTRFSLPIFSFTMALGEHDREALRCDHQRVASRLVREYLARLGEAGVLSKNQILAELRSIFALIRDECAAFGRRKKGKPKDRVLLIMMALNEAIASDNPERLLGQWNRWQGMVDSTSPNWIGISLPTDMILEGYLVLEDFIPVKEYLEAYYDPFSLDSRNACD